MLKARSQINPPARMCDARFGRLESPRDKLIHTVFIPQTRTRVRRAPLSATEPILRRNNQRALALAKPSDGPGPDLKHEKFIRP